MAVKTADPPEPEFGLIETTDGAVDAVTVKVPRFCQPLFCPIVSEAYSHSPQVPLNKGWKVTGTVRVRLLPDGATLAPVPEIVQRLLESVAAFPGVSGPCHALPASFISHR